MKARMAKEALKWLFKDQNAAEIAFRVVPDVGFGILEGAMTPGDLGDKILAGTGTAVGGVTGGIRKQCSMLVSGVDCKNTKGCSWNYSTGMCH